MSSATKREGGGPDGAVTARFEYPVPGTIIAEKYRVERTLGEGGMGLVVSATHMGLEQEVAIKFLLPDAMRNEVAVERFLREAKVAAKIKSDYVARVHDVGTLAGSGGVPYIVMEHLHGSDLGQLIEQNGALAVEEACEIVLQACEGLAQVHAAGIVHRDLKPSNVFVTRNADGSPAVKLLDFGISKLTLDPEGSTIDPALTATATIMGSPSYMSPEQLRSTKEVDGRADVWSLGAVLYEAITGAPAFRGETLPQVCAMIASEDPVPPSTRRADLPEELEACILRCLDKAPATREPLVELARVLARFAPQRGKASLERIEATVAASEAGDLPVVSLGGVTDRTRTTGGRNKGKGTSRPWLGTAFLLVVGGLSAVAVYGEWFRSRSPAPAPSRAGAAMAAAPTAVAVAPPASASPGAESAASAASQSKPSPGGSADASPAATPSAAPTAAPVASAAPASSAKQVHPAAKPHHAVKPLHHHHS